MYVNKANAGSVPISGTTEAGTVVSVTVRSGLSQSLTQQVTPTGTSWSTTMDLTTLGDGTLTYTAATTDSAGNSGTATAAGTTSKGTAAPAAAGITLTNGGSKQGTPERSDTLTIRFDDAMDPTKFCPNWNGAALSGTATISNGTTSTNDTINFTTNTCTSPVIGTILLGADYVGSQAAVFGANGNASTLTWDATAKTLTVKLGNYSNNSGSVSTVTSGSPSYAPAASLTDLAGNSVLTTAVNGATTF
ncbi:Ig-like domain-containing protein [Arthrobacter nitrophenolicus]|nr:Ig-like domain-containing protein [Arthrobacter nitrophenolicus]